MNSVSGQDVHSLVGGQELVQVIQELQQAVALCLHARCCARCVLVCSSVPHLRRHLADHLWEPHPCHVTKIKCHPGTMRSCSTASCMQACDPHRPGSLHNFPCPCPALSLHVPLQDGYPQACDEHLGQQRHGSAQNSHLPAYIYQIVQEWLHISQAICAVQQQPPGLNRLQGQVA